MNPVQLLPSAAALVFLAGICQAAVIDRIDIYDKADNHLMFVTFAYDGTGRNIGRSVFASDSTFLRSTTFQTDGGGNVVKENSVDFDSNAVFSTTLTQQTGKTTFTIADQFGLDQLGSPMSATQTSANNYDISQRNVVSYKEQYLLNGDGSLSRVNITDAAGTLQYYAIATLKNPVVQPGHSAANGPAALRVRNGQYIAQFQLQKPGRVTLELYTPAGRLAAVLMDKSFGAGIHSEKADILSGRQKQLGNGTYVLKMSVHGRQTVTTRLMVQR